jgi:acyl-[acyl-carrier-protein] desaturase
MPIFDNKLPVKFHLPEIIKGPWTRDARQRALDREMLEHYIEYFGRSMQTRNWSPWHNFPLEEMRQWGHKLGQETIHLIEGFLGVEEYVGDYVLDSLEMFREQRTRRNMQLQWGAEETKHGVAWELVLKHSLARTEEQLQAYFDKIKNFRWSLKDHAGADTPLGISAYAMVQERATYFNYQEVRGLIRADYGLPATPTPEELRRGYEVGASEAFRVVGVDEIAHHGIFLKVVQSHIKYFPSMTFEVLEQVFKGFHMPSLNIIPNARHFLRAVNRTSIYSGPIHREKVHNPVLKALGLDNDDAFEQAVQLARKLPENLGPDSVKLSRLGEWVVGFSEAAAPSAA